METYKFLKCKSCGFDELDEFIDFGNNPISTSYKLAPSEVNKFYKLSMAVCKRCGTAQLLDHIPESKLVNPPSWITYNEPEFHLDSLVDELMALVDNRSAKVRGLSYKDQSTIDRFNSFGYHDTQMYDFNFNLKSTQIVNIEQLQKLVTPQNCLTVSSNQNLADILLVRHVLEHTFDTESFMSGIKTLIKVNGLVVFEIPDCSQQFEKYDYTCLWEEHTIYFVEQTFRGILEQNGFKLEKFFTYKYATENSLVAICTLNNNPEATPTYQTVTLNSEYSGHLTNFRDNFSTIKSDTHNYVVSQKEKDKVIIFGAGHLSVTFIHLFDLSSIIDFVVDDDPNKCGKCIPGTSIEIRGSDSLLNEQIGTCFLSLSPESESRFLSEKMQLLSNVTTIKSIFPGKENSIPRSIKLEH